MPRIPERVAVGARQPLLFLPIAGRGGRGGGREKEHARGRVRAHVLAHTHAPAPIRGETPHTSTRSWGYETAWLDRATMALRVSRFAAGRGRGAGSRRGAAEFFCAPLTIRRRGVAPQTDRPTLCVTPTSDGPPTTTDGQTAAEWPSGRAAERRSKRATRRQSPAHASTDSRLPSATTDTTIGCHPRAAVRREKRSRDERRAAARLCSTAQNNKGSHPATDDRTAPCRASEGRPCVARILRHARSYERRGTSDERR